MTEEQIKKLKEENSEYVELCEIIDSYDTFINLYHLHFCKKLEDGTYEFSEEFAKKNAEFLQNWAEKRKKLETRLKKNKYFSRGGKISDERDLKYGQRRYFDLEIYSQLENDFAEIESKLVDLSNSDEKDLRFYIEELKKQKEKIERESNKKAKTPKQKQ